MFPLYQNHAFTEGNTHSKDAFVSLCKRNAPLTRLSPISSMETMFLLSEWPLRNTMQGTPKLDAILSHKKIPHFIRTYPNYPQDKKMAFRSSHPSSIYVEVWSNNRWRGPLRYSTSWPSRSEHFGDLFLFQDVCPLVYIYPSCSSTVACTLHQSKRSTNSTTIVECGQRNC